MASIGNMNIQKQIPAIPPDIHVRNNPVCKYFLVFVLIQSQILPISVFFSLGLVNRDRVNS